MKKIIQAIADKTGVRELEVEIVIDELSLQVGTSPERLTEFLQHGKAKHREAIQKLANLDKTIEKIKKPRASKKS